MKLFDFSRLRDITFLSTDYINFKMIFIQMNSLSEQISGITDTQTQADQANAIEANENKKSQIK